MIEFRNVSVVYPSEIQALKDLSLRIEKGEFVFIVGSTGTGKSTLLRLINREEIPTSGQVIVDGANVGRLKARFVPKLRRSIGVVFQDLKLLPQKTSAENVAFALYVTNTPRHEIGPRVQEALELVGLSERASAYPGELSGGEQQRICIARAIVNNPPILLADEPTGHMDPSTSLEIIQILGRINLLGTTVIVASHDQHVVDEMQKRVVQIDGGMIIRDEQEGGYHEPANA
jgi:cell division transport system ATP-binding protein